jgi:hypothetical protein
VLWLCGPAGVGKSTVSWQLFTDLARAGAQVAFADTDQLCMCYPAPPADPGRELLKALNLNAMTVNYRVAGDVRRRGRKLARAWRSAPRTVG